MTFTGRLRDLWRAWRLQHWAARDAFPRRLVRTYASEDERDRDSKRLAAHGYQVADEVDSGATIDVAPPQNVYSRDIPARMLLDMPLARVIYEREPSPRREA